MDAPSPEQRRQFVNRLLLQGRRVVSGELARQWGCSERSVRRTITQLRDQDGLPLEKDGDSWSSRGSLAELPPLLVNPEDRRALLLSLQAAAQFEDMPIGDQIRRLYQTFLKTLPPERATSFGQMMKDIRFTGPKMPPIKAEVWREVLICLEARETMHMTYTDGGYGSKTDREVDPYGLIMRDRHWILVAYCRLKNGVRTFALHRIGTAECTDKTFAMPADFMDEYMAGEFDGLSSSEVLAKVVLRIRKDAPPYVMERRWSDSEKRSRDAKGDMIVEFKTSALFVVEREVRAEGGQVELVEPKASRMRLEHSARALMKAHG